MAYIPIVPITGGGTGATTISGAQTNLQVPASSTVMLLNGSQSMTGTMNLGGFTVQNSGTPVNPTDLCTKGYADGLAQGLSPKPSCIVATTAALSPTYTYNNGTSGAGATLTASSTGTLTIDGHLTALGDTLLIKNETGGNAPYNGIYTVTTAGASGVAYVLTRSVDMNSSTEFQGGYTYIESGSTNANSQWACSNTSAPVVGTTAITFVQISGAGTYTAGNGLTGTTTFSVLANGSTISVSSSGIQINTSYPGQSSITTLGTITTGVWNGTALTASYLPATVAYTGAGNGWSVAQVPNAAGTIDLGSTTYPWRAMYITDPSDATYNLKLAAASLSGNYTVTFPNANSNTVVPNSGTANQWVYSISATGTITTSQPASTNLSDSTNLVRVNTANTYTGTFLQDFSAAGQTLKTAGGGTTVSGTFVSDTQGNRALGSATLNFSNLYLGTTTYSALITSPSMTANRTFTLPDANSNPVQPSSGSTNQFAIGISSAGVISYAQPSFANLSSTVTNKTANYTLLSTDSGKLFTVTASTSGIVLTLPAGTSGLWYELKNKVASTNSIAVAPNGTDKIENVNSNFSNILPGESITLTWDSSGTPNEWVVT